MIKLPDTFRRNATNLLGDKGREWLRQLPEIVDECSHRWECEFADPVADLSINYVAPGVRKDGTPVVLKACIPTAEYITEVEALRLIGGDGAVRLLEWEGSLHALLLERLSPGTTLNEVADEGVAIHNAAIVMRRIWRPDPHSTTFPTVHDWIMHMAASAAAIIPPGHPFPRDWIDTSLSIYNELARSASDGMLLHGDLHKANILSAQREPWLAIDPKGVIGPPIWETGPLLLNIINPGEETSVTRANIDRCVNALAGELGFDRHEIAVWGIVRAVLSGFWTVEDHGSDWINTIRTAEILTDLA